MSPAFDEPNPFGPIWPDKDYEARERAKVEELMRERDAIVAELEKARGQGLPTEELTNRLGWLDRELRARDIIESSSY